MLRAIVSIGFVQIAGIIVATLRSKIFALLLGPAGFGVVATIDQLVMSIAQFANLSLPFTAMKFLSKSHSQGREQFRETYVIFLQIIAVLASGAMGLAFVCIPLALTTVDSQLAAHGKVVRFALLGIPATMLQMFLINAVAARQESTLSVLLTVLAGIVSLAAGSVGCYIAGIPGIYASLVPANLLFIVGVVLFLRARRGLTLRNAPPNAWRALCQNRAVWETAGNTYIAVGSSAVMLLSTRYFCISTLGPEPAGLLHACLGIALSIGAILGPATSLYFTPFINRELPSSEKITATDNFIPRLVFLFSVGALPVILYPALTLKLLFSAQFEIVAGILPWFVAWQSLYHISNVYQQLLIGLDDVRGHSLATTAGNLASVGVCALTIRPFGLRGIAFSFIAGTAVTVILTVIRLRSRHQISTGKSILVYALPIVLLIPLLALVSQPLVELSILGTVLRLAIACLSITVFWLCLPKPIRTDFQSAAVKFAHRRFGKTLPHAT